MTIASAGDILRERKLFGGIIVLAEDGDGTTGLGGVGRAVAGAVFGRWKLAAEVVPEVIILLGEDGCDEKGRYPVGGFGMLGADGFGVAGRGGIFCQVFEAGLGWKSGLLAMLGLLIAGLFWPEEV